MAVNTETPNDTKSTDRIEKRVVLRAPRTRVWRALTNAAEFGTWFRVKLEGAFTEGKSVRGRLSIPGYEHVTLELLIERIDPERYFSYRWHPDRKSTRLNSSHQIISYAVFCLKKKSSFTVAVVRAAGVGGRDVV